VSTFLAEVGQHPAALRELVARYRGAERDKLHAWAAKARAAGRVVFAGMGTSAFVAEASLPAMARLGVDGTALDAGEALHYPRPLPALVVLISQSGESYETVRLAAQLAGSHELVTIVNDGGSTLARAASLVLPLCAGGESAISTKTYANSLALLYLLSAALAGETATEAGLDALDRLAGALAAVDGRGIARAAALLADAGAIQFIARGPALVAAKQAALTFMEGTRTPAAAFTGGAFRHGPFELVDANHRCVFFIASGATGPLLRRMAEEVAALGSRAVAIGNLDLALPPATCWALPVPACDEDLFPLAAAPTQELLLYAVAARRGVAAGVFRHGGKVTTRE